MRTGTLGLLLGGYTLRANCGKFNLTGVRIKEYSTPTTPGDQQNVHSCRATTYVFAAPDSNSSADSIGKFAGAGFSRTLQEGVKFTTINRE